jgi:hypothetical protein
MNEPIKTPEELVKWAEAEHSKQLDRISQADIDEAFQLKEEDPDAYQDNEENR